MNKRSVRGSALLPVATRTEVCAAAIAAPRVRARRAPVPPGKRR